MTVRKDPRSGRYFFRTWVRFPDGRRERVFGTPGVPGPYHDLRQTAAGAAEAERRAIVKALTGVDVKPVVAPLVPTVGEYVEAFMTGYAAAHKPSSRKDKQQRLDHDIVPLLGEVRLDQLRQEHVDRLVAKLLERKLARKSINTTTSVLSSLVGYAATNKVITDPDLRFQIAAQDTELVAVAPEHVDALIEAARMKPRYQLAIMLAADAGLRIGEIRALARADVNQISREIAIARSYDRSGQLTETKGWERRVVPMSARLWAAFVQLEERGPLVFSRLDGAPIGYDAVRDEVHEIYDAAGVVAPRMPWHALRHTFGTELANGGASIQTIREMMGHKSIETTMRYLHSTRSAKREAVKNLGSQRAADPKVSAK
jgi:integrase